MRTKVDPGSFSPRILGRERVAHIHEAQAMFLPLLLVISRVLVFFAIRADRDLVRARDLHVTRNVLMTVLGQTHCFQRNIS